MPINATRLPTLRHVHIACIDAIGLPNERLTQEAYWAWVSVVSHQQRRFI
jgi:hypothetical protein